MYLATDTGNTKIVGKPRRGYAAALNLPIAQTCPRSCPVKGECYAKGGRMALRVARLERETGKKSAAQVASLAAREMRLAADQGLARDRVLRLFGSGDARTERAASTSAAAARHWQRKGGDRARVWGYTHAWRDVPAAAWAGVSVLASTEGVAGAKRAMRAGYAPAIVVPEHTGDRRYRVEGLDVLPCPNQTRGIACVECRLCFDAPRLLQTRTAIGFAAHGNRARALRERLVTLGRKAA